MGYKDKEKAKEYRKRYYAINKERESEYRKRYYAEHREEAKESSRQYYKNNKDKISKQHAQYMRKYYEKNKDRIQKYHRQYMRDYNKTSKEVVCTCNKRWTEKYASTKRTMWTAEEEATLFELQAEGLTISEIAVALGRSRDSVQSKIGRVHRKQKMESINELHDLIELYHINSNLGGD